jgi:hypothetical protein
MELTFRNRYVARSLAVFCRRVTFDDAYRCADGETEDERKAMAYRILAALSDLKTCLDDDGRD